MTVQPKTSPRLGPIQVAVLDALRREGKWMTAVDVMIDVHTILDRQGNTIEYSCGVSVRRAVNSLAKKRLVRVGQGQPRFQRDTRCRMICWLPEHEAPRSKFTIPGRACRSLILASLEKIDAAKAAEHRAYYEVRRIPAWARKNYSPHPLDVPYAEIVDDLLRRVDQYDATRIRMALFRATLTLRKEGKIKALVGRKQEGKRTVRRIFYIRLADPIGRCDVTTVSNIATHGEREV